LRPTPKRIEAKQVAGVIGQMAGVALSLPGQLAVVARVVIIGGSFKLICVLETDMTVLRDETWPVRCWTDKMCDTTSAVAAM